MENKSSLLVRWVRRLRSNTARQVSAPGPLPENAPHHVPRPLPALEVIVEVDFEEGSFVAPQPWQRATGRIPGQGEVVCWVGFGVSPLYDRIYVDGLEVAEAYRRQGYASALLKAVADRVSPEDQALPVTALHEVFESNRFWSALRQGAVPKLVVTQDVRASEMDDEARRWRG